MEQYKEEGYWVIIFSYKYYRPILIYLLNKTKRNS